MATGRETNVAYALWEALVPPGGGPPPHVHSREEEGFYLLEGEITFTVDGERVVANTGTFANMPVGTPHSFKNESDRLAEGATSAAPPTKDEIERLLAIAPKYGITILVPGLERPMSVIGE
jgi:quercetin dioxygenase-like cupin family protein